MKIERITNLFTPVNNGSILFQLVLGITIQQLGIKLFLGIRRQILNFWKKNIEKIDKQPMEAFLAATS